MKLFKDGQVMLEVGDKVRIKDRPVTGGGLFWNGAMNHYCGKEVTIRKVFRHGDQYRYYIQENGWTYINEFFELNGVFGLARDTGGTLKTDGFSDYINMFRVVG